MFFGVQCEHRHVIIDKTGRQAYLVLVERQARHESDPRAHKTLVTLDLAQLLAVEAVHRQPLDATVGTKFE